MFTASGARRALDLFTGTTRVAQEFKRRGGHVTAVDTRPVLARCSRAATSRPTRDPVDLDALADALARPRRARPGSPGTSPRRSARAVPLPPARERRAGRRDPRRHREPSTADSPLYPVLLTSLIEAADRVDSTAGVQMAYLKQWAPRAHNRLTLRVPELLAGPGHRGARRRASSWPPRSARSTSPTSTRRTTSTATSRTTTCGRRSSRGTSPSTTASRASAIDARDDATQERVQPQARDARRAARRASRPSTPRRRDPVVQRRELDRARRARRAVRSPRSRRGARVRLEPLRRRADRRPQPGRRTRRRGLAPAQPRVRAGVRRCRGTVERGSTAALRRAPRVTRKPRSVDRDPAATGSPHRG